MPLFTKVGPSWVEIPSGPNLHLKVGASWVEGRFLWYKNGSTWVRVWSGSDPVTVQYDPRDVGSYRPSGWRSESLAYQASWDFGDHIGCFGYDWQAIAAQLAERSKVVQVRLRLNRQPNHGIGGNIAAMVWSLSNSAVNASGGLIRSGQPDLVNGSRNDYGSFPRDSGNIWVTIADVYAERIRDGNARGIGLALDESLSSTGGQKSEYGIFSGGRLEITSDYA